MRKILILTAPFGLGHTKAAEALRLVIARDKAFADVEIIVKDVFDIAYEVIGKAIVRSYLKLLDAFPTAYGMLYGWGDGSKVSLMGRDAAHAILARGLLKYVLRMSPMCIICTHPTPAGAMEYLVRKKNLNTPILALITDFVGHNWWIYHRLSRYFVPSAEVKEYFAAQGIDRKKIIISGIPIDEKFKVLLSSGMRKEERKRSLGFSQKLPLVLMMGGGEGILPMDKITEACFSMSEEMQLVVVTGSNIDLYKKLKKQSKNVKGFLTVYGYTDKVPELMMSADVLITKPGGVTMAEALMMQLPMIIFRPIPGQEEGNNKYLLKNEAAIYVEEYSDFTVVLRDLLQNQDKLQQLKANIAKLVNDKCDEIITVQLKEYLRSKGHKL